MKIAFAKELLAGEWRIVADYNGKEAVFQLVPLNEINEIKQFLHKKPIEIAMKRDIDVNDAIVKDNNPD